MDVLVVDDHPAVRLGLSAMLGAAEGVQVVGEAAEAAAAVQLVRELRPDLVILDLRLSDEDSGAEICRQMKKLPDPPKVVIHTAHNAAADVSSCQLSGADSFVHKSEEPSRLLETLKQTHAGRNRWFFGCPLETSNPYPWSAADRACLTVKEKEVFVLLLRRRTNREIAEALYMSPLTVKTHVASILRKMGLKSRRDLC